jgi:dephospho-CoA kinase
MGKIILGISGEIASGKDTVAHYLVDRYGATLFMFSDPLRDILGRLHLVENRENLTRISGIIRKEFGDDILSKSIAMDAVKDPGPLVVIDGVRRHSDIEAVKGHPEFSLIYVEADMRIRYERIVKRRQNSDDETKTFEEFKKDHLLETEIAIPELKDHSRFVVDNSGTLEDLFGQVDAVMAELRKEADFGDVYGSAV